MSYTTLITAAQLAELAAQSQCCIVDCRFDLADTSRGENAYTQGRIPGSCYAHLDHDLSSPITSQTGRHPLPEIERLKQWLGRHGIRPNTQVVAYDDSGGNMAVRLWWLLRWLGHKKVALLDGGWQHWLSTGLPIETDKPKSPPSAEFEGDVEPGQVITSDQLYMQLSTGSSRWLIMDARTRERFRGEAEPIDPVAGRIPGAINLPLQMNLAADGTFKSATELKKLYTRALNGRPPSNVVVMCGSGVTACHNLLAMEIAGLPGGRLYAGSWSEWIRDPTRPVATGD
jgi:thiosulfate/3-mercaptopyruvate sulfurtransferase